MLYSVGQRRKRGDIPVCIYFFYEDGAVRILSTYAPLQVYRCQRFVA